MVTGLTQKAFTLIEIMIALVISAVLILVSIPSMNNFFESSRLLSASNTLLSDLQYVRSEAIKRNVNIYVAFTSGSSWCYAYSDTTSCNCAQTTAGQADYCQAGSVHYSRGYTDYKGITLTESFTANQMSFGALRGDVVTGLTGASQTITLSSTNYSVNIIINSAGLVSACANGAGIGRYPAC